MEIKQLTIEDAKEIQEMLKKKQLEVIEKARHEMAMFDITQPREQWIKQIILSYKLLDVATDIEEMIQGLNEAFAKHEAGENVKITMGCGCRMGSFPFGMPGGLPTDARTLFALLSSILK